MGKVRTLVLLMLVACEPGVAPESVNSLTLANEVVTRGVDGLARSQLSWFFPEARTVHVYLADSLYSSHSLPSGEVELIVTGDAQVSVLASATDERCLLRRPHAACSVREVSLSVVEAASISLSPSRLVVAPGGDAVFELTTSAGSVIDVSCAGATCSLDSGLLTVHAPLVPTAVVVEVHGLGEDRLGDARASAAVELEGWPQVLDLNLSRAASGAGGEIVVAWANLDADEHELEISEAVFEMASIDECRRAPTAAGVCTLRVLDAPVQGETSVGLVARRGEARSSRTAREVAIGVAPRLAIEVSEPSNGRTTLRWQAFGADRIWAFGGEVFDLGTGELEVEIGSNTEVVVHADNTFGRTTRSRAIVVEERPLLHSVLVDGVLVEHGQVVSAREDELSLSWIARETERVTLARALGGCEGASFDLVTELASSGVYRFFLPGASCLQLVAQGANGEADTREVEVRLEGLAFTGFGLATDDALVDGEMIAATGDVPILWSAPAARTVRVDVADAAGVSCEDAPYGTRLIAGPTFALVLPAVSRDQCVRLVATSATGATTSVSSRLRDRPVAHFLSLPAPGAPTVTVRARGASSLRVEAQVFDDEGELLRTEPVCEPAATDATEDEAFSCAFAAASGEQYRFRMTATDIEGDETLVYAE